MKKKVDETIEDLKRQVDEWKNKYLRALADYQNLEKRTHGEREETRRFALVVFLERLLPVLDTLERAQEHLGDQGLALAIKEFAAILSGYGVEKIKAVGGLFNPHEMECIEVVDGEENRIMEEVLPGYRIHGKVLRVAQVKVGKQINESTNEKSTNEK